MAGTELPRLTGCVVNGWLEISTNVALLAPAFSGGALRLGSTYWARMTPVVLPGCHESVVGAWITPPGAACGRFRPPICASLTTYAKDCWPEFVKSLPT